MKKKLENTICILEFDKNLAKEYFNILLQFYKNLNVDEEYKFSGVTNIVKHADDISWRYEKFKLEIDFLGFVMKNILFKQNIINIQFFVQLFF